MMDQFGQNVVTNPTQMFMNLNNGDQYPCGNNDPTNPTAGTPKCYLFYGSNLNMGQPTKITMTDFNCTTQIKARLILYNPATSGIWFSINVKAYQGQSGGTSTLIGTRYVGYWRFPNAFLTTANIASSTVYTASSTGITGTSYLYPCNPALTGTNAGYSSTNSLWADNTNWIITGSSLSGISQSVNQYIIFSVVLSD
jgi:hypothetical protein